MTTLNKELRIVLLVSLYYTLFV